MSHPVLLREDTECYKISGMPPLSKPSQIDGRIQGLLAAMNALPEDARYLEGVPAINLRSALAIDSQRSDDARERHLQALDYVRHFIEEIPPEAQEFILDGERLTAENALCAIRLR